jgi:hypothetical protein
MMTEKEFNEQIIDWNHAISHLNAVIAGYAAIGAPGSFALKLTLLPLKARYDEEERTVELYNEIMECE